LRETAGSGEVVVDDVVALPHAESVSEAVTAATARNVRIFFTAFSTSRNR
jgi:hypothetical protein